MNNDAPFFLVLMLIFLMLMLKLADSYRAIPGRTSPAVMTEGSDPAAWTPRTKPPAWPPGPVNLTSWAAGSRS